MTIVTELEKKKTIKFVSIKDHTDKAVLSRKNTRGIVSNRKLY